MGDDDSGTEDSDEGEDYSEEEDEYSEDQVEEEGDELLQLQPPQHLQKVGHEQGEQQQQQLQHPQEEELQQLQQVEQREREQEEQCQQQQLQLQLQQRLHRHQYLHQQEEHQQEEDQQQQLQQLRYHHQLQDHYQLQYHHQLQYPQKQQQQEKHQEESMDLEEGERSTGEASEDSISETTLHKRVQEWEEVIMGYLRGIEAETGTVEVTKQLNRSRDYLLYMQLVDTTLPNPVTAQGITSLSTQQEQNLFEALEQRGAFQAFVDARPDLTSTRHLWNVLRERWLNYYSVCDEREVCQDEWRLSSESVAWDRSY